jgi:hypothetical protein
MQPGALLSRSSPAPLAAPHSPRAFGTNPLLGPAATITVYATWAALSAGLFWFVASFGGNYPWPDEWEMIPALVGKTPVTLTWLFSRHAEHCVPLSRAILLGLAKITHCDFRAGMFASAFVLSLAALALINCARRMRGYTSIGDVLFPLLLLHFGHRENLLQGWNLQNALFCTVAILALTILFGARFTPSPRASIALGVLLVLLPWLGAAGIVIAIPLAIWLITVGRRLLRLAQHRQSAIASMVLALLSLAICRGLLGFKPRPLAAAIPWAFILMAVAVWRRGLRPIWAATCSLLFLAGALLSAWRPRFDESSESAGVTLALLLASWLLFSSVRRFFSSPQGPRVQNLLMAGAGIALWIGLVAYKPPDQDIVTMFLAGLALALAMRSLPQLHSSGGRWGMLASVLVLLALTMQPARTSAPASPSMMASLRGTVMFMSTAFGQTTTYHWPLSGVLILFLFLAATSIAFRRMSADRVRWTGILAYLLAFAVLALATGWGRSGIMPNFCLEERYSLLSLPLLCCIYLTVGEGPTIFAGSIAQLALAALVLAWSPTNFKEGLRTARYGHEQGVRFQEDIKTGKPLPYLMHRYQWLIPGWHGNGIFPVHFAQMAEGMRLLHDAGVGNFAQLQTDLPPSDLVVLDPNDTIAGVASAKRNAGVLSGSLSIHLSRPRYVRAILVLYSTPVQGSASVRVQVDYRTSSAEVIGDVTDYERTPGYGVGASWVDRTIDELSITCRCADGQPRIEKVALLVPADATPSRLLLGNLFFRFR